MSTILQCEHVGARRHGSRELLRDLDLTLLPGAVTVVFGKRREGKTLLAEIAAGLRRPDRGRVRLFGRDVATVAARERPMLRRRIGYAEEHPMLLEDVSLAANVALPLRLQGTKALPARAEADEFLRQLGSPEPAARAGPDTTPEERLRVGLARAMIARPRLLVLDTPLRAANDATAARLVALVNALRNGGAAVLITADTAREAAIFADARTCELDAGTLRTSGMSAPLPFVAGSA